MAGRQLWVSMIVCVCATMALFGVIAGSAGALQTRLLQEGFGQDGTPSAGFFYPLSVGLDQSTGNVYVGSADGTVRKFAPVHVSEAFSGIAPNISEGDLTGFGDYAEVHQIAVNSYTAGAAAHDIYVVGENSSVAAYQPDGEPAQFTAGPDSGTNELKGSEVCGVAVDTSGDIYVSEFSTGVHIFSESGESITSISVPGACNLGVDSSGVLYVNTLSGPQNGQSGPILKFTPSHLPPVTAATTFEANGVVGSNPSLTLTVDPSDDHLFADEGGQVTEYDQTGSPVDTFGAGATGGLVGSQGIAVNDASEQVYVANTEGSQRQVEIFGPVVTLPDVTTEPASNIDPHGSATLNGRVKPDGVALTACQFEYIEATLYEPSAANPYAAGAIAQCEPAAGAIPTAGETEVHVRLSGLPPGVRYDYRLVASNKTASDKNPSSYGANVELVLPPLPTIEAADASNLTRNSAELSVRINPGSLSTTYHFEYDTTPFAPGEPEGSHGTRVGAGELAANAGSTEIGPLTITDLKEDKTYYWRVVATNAAGTTLGADHTFIYDTSGEGLPDHRAYEMVTPPHKNAALIGGGTHVTQVAEDGSRVSTVTFQCFGDAESCVPLHYLDLGQPVLFTRGSPGWTANALQPPASEFASDGYLKSDPNTGMALFSIPTPPMFEEDIYAREPSGEFEDVGPLTPPSEGPQPEPFSSGGKGADVNATSDFSHVAYENVTLGQAVQYSGFSDQAPNLVGVSGGQGSKDLISQCGTALGNFEGVSPGEMSEDGETVYFTAGSNAGGCAAGGTGANAGKVVPVDELFARVGGGTANARTVALSEPSAFSAAAPYPGCEKEPCVKDVNEQANWRGAEFEGASADGSKAFFLSDQQLTDTATEGQGNLYEYDFDDPSEAGRLIDVSVGDRSGLGPQVQGVLAIGSDGSHVYFVARGVLSSAPNGLGETAKAGADNLYVFERDTSYPDGRTAFVTQLTESDRQEWGAEVPPGNAERNLLQGDANVTPDGRYLVFESRGRLTPDTTRPEGGPTQIYRYDAQTGDLVRVSIGERGFNDNGNAGPGDAHDAAVGDAQIVPQGFVGKFFAPAGPSRSDPTMSNDGQYIFFESPIGLTPHALNDVQIGTTNTFSGSPVLAENVYEWHEGQVHLISDGKDTSIFANEERSSVSLVGSDATGANVFFSTADPLVAKDTDTQIDIYDARICEPERGDPCISEPLPALPPCQGEACHGTPAGMPAAPGAPTVTFNGQGNLGGLAPAGAASKPTGRRGKRVARCRRGERRVHGVCVKRKGKKTRAERAKGRPAGKTMSGKRGG